MINSYEIAGITVKADLTNDVYGDSMWQGAADGQWESSTVGFVLTNSRPGTVFFDIGAASGIFSLLSALRGASVVAVEPHPIWFAALESNVKLNKLDNQIHLHQAAIGSADGVINFNEGRDRKIISDSAALRAQGTTPVISLGKLIEKNQGTRTVLKIDIEGAEYALLLGGETISKLEASKSLVFISLHPGFPYQKVYNQKSLRWFLNALGVKIRGHLDNWKLFQHLRKSAKVSLPNGREVIKTLDFLLLAGLGVHDFVIDFDTP